MFGYEFSTPLSTVISTIAALSPFALLALWIIGLRTVVETNEVHIVQGRGPAKSYGTNSPNGNVYYDWPSWIPLFGVTVTSLPLSVFSIDIKEYVAYDRDRLPFNVHVVAFFRIVNTNLAASRISSEEELLEQLEFIVKGAIRVILGSRILHEIMEGRSELGEAFTKEVNDGLQDWGVSTVKMIEFMSIHDAEDSNVIENIMAKKMSEIDKDSRTARAGNRKAAETAEIEASREIDLQKQEAIQQVENRKVEVARDISLNQQRAQQQVKTEERTTAERTMEVQRVNQVKATEIAREMELIEADKNARTTVILAEAELKGKQLTAQGELAVGAARADVDKAILMAPVAAQAALAKEIGQNKEYQTYLLTVRQIEAQEKIGVAQAAAMNEADIKIIANAEGPGAGIAKVSELFTARGGTAVGTMMEGLANTPAGKALLETAGVTTGGEETRH